MRILATIALLALSLTPAFAQSFEGTDAPASYGAMAAGYDPFLLFLPRLGPTKTFEPTRTIAPQWTGDIGDDGIVSMPVWDSWSSNNQLEVECNGDYFLLLMWVDANDDGAYSTDERYEYSSFVLAQGAVPFGQGRRFTFEGIRIHATQDFSLNGPNKVAVRICVQNGSYPLMANPNGIFYSGEVEDWLIDVEPAKFTVATEFLDDAYEGQSYSAAISPVNEGGSFTWSLTAGTLPSGLSLAQSGDDFVLSGTPAAGSGAGLQTYSLTVECASSGGGVVTRDITLTVWPAPAAAPFEDDFSSSRGWKLEGTWARVPAAYHFCGGTSYVHGVPATDPAADHSSGSDGFILADTPASALPWLAPRDMVATSPKVDCSGLTQVEFRYYRWLSLTEWHRYRVDATNDGVNWTTVWRPAEDPIQLWPVYVYSIADAGWTLRSHDISAIAAGSSSVQVRIVFEGTETGTCWPWANGGTILPQDIYGGFNIDDVRIGAPMGNGGASLSAFVVQSPDVYQHTSGDYPRAYPLFTHNWSAELSGGAENITFTEAEVAVQYEPFPGQTTGLPIGAGAGERAANPTWFDGSVWKYTYPAAAAASATGLTVQGTWYFTAAPGVLAGHPSRLTLYLRGTTASGEPIELTIEERILWQAQGYPGLYAHEGSATGAVIMPGAPAGGLRNFGSVPPFTQSGWLQIFVENTSATTLNPGVPVLVGPAASEFEINTSAFPTSLPPGAGAYFEVRFAPQTFGRRNARVEFTHDAQNAPSPFLCGLTGNGAGSGPILRVFENGPAGTPIGNGSPAAGARDFGVTGTTGGPAGPSVIYIENSGNQDLVLGTPQLSGASGFSLDLSQFSTVVTPGNATSFDVYFAPPGVGTFQAAVTWTHNDPGQGTDYVVNLAGAGVVYAPSLEVRERTLSGPAIGNNAPAAGARQFGPVPVSSGPTAWLEIVVRNLGLQDLVLVAPVLTGTHAADFALDTTGLIQTLTTNSVTTFRVAFDPRAKGTKNAAIEFANNDPTQSPFVINLAGLGEDPLGVTVVTNVLPGGQIGEDYGPFTFSGQGGTAPYQWSTVATGLPAGLLLEADGALHGIPTGNFGLFTFQVQVTDALGGDEFATCSISLSPPVGFVGKGQGSADSSGCAAGNGSGWLVLLGLLVLAGCASRSRRAGGAAALAVGLGLLAGPVFAQSQLSPKTEISYGGNPPPAGNVTQGATNHPCLQFAIERYATAAAAVTLLAVQLSDNGNLPAGEYDRLSLWVDANANGQVEAGDTLLMDTTSITFPVSFTGLGYAINPGEEIEFLVTADVSPGATLGREISVLIEQMGGLTLNPSLVTSPGSLVGAPQIVIASPPPILEVFKGSTTGPGLNAGDTCDFGVADLAAMPTVATTIVIANSGGGNLVVGQPTLIGADFVLDLNGFTATVAPGANTSFALQFNATTPGSKVAQVEFTHNGSAGGSPFWLELTGVAVNGFTPFITTAALPDGEQGTAYGPIPITATGGLAPYSFSTTAGPMPPGIQVSPVGVEGLPTQAGDYVFTLRVTDSLAAFSETQFSLHVRAAPLTSGGSSGGAGGCVVATGSGASGLLLPLLMLWRRRKTAGRLVRRRG